MTQSNIPSQAAQLTKVGKLVAKIKSDFEGENLALLTLNEDEFAGQINFWVPTGLIPYDIITGGGFPTSRVVEVYGPEAAFKTGLNLLALDHCLLMGGVAVLNDAEQAIDRRKVRNHANEGFLYMDENILEEFYRKTDLMMQSLGGDKDTLSLFAWDSLPMTIPKSAFEQDHGTKTYAGGGSAKMHAESLPRILKPVKNANCCFSIINQIRDNMDAGMFDDPYTTPGGWVPKYLASIRVQMTIGGKLKWNDSDRDPAGFKVHAYTKKNKIHPPMRKVTIPVYYDLGADPAMCLLDYLLELKMAKGPGGRYVIDGLNLGKPSFFYREFRVLYRDNIEKILIYVKEKLNFQYGEVAEKAVIAYAKQIYAGL